MQYRNQPALIRRNKFPTAPTVGLYWQDIRILIRRILLSADARLATQGVARSPTVSEGFEINIAN